MTEHAGRVLVIDDDQGTRDLCAQTLRGVGFDVVPTMADVALDRLSGAPFDLVLLDMAAPDAGEPSMLAQIRSYDASLPVLLLSGAATVVQLSHAIRLGVEGLLLKPFVADELVTLAGEVMAKWRSTRARERVAALRPLLQVSQRLHAELDLSRLQDLIIETVRSEIGADRASLMLLEDDAQILRIVACSGLPPEVTVGHGVPASRGLAGWVAAHRTPLCIDAGGEVSPPNADLRGVFFADEMTSSLAVPVLAGDYVLGVLNAAKVRSMVPFSAADQDLLLLLAGQAATAITNARLYSEVAHSEERYRALLQHANDAVLLLDASGHTILEANLAIEQLSGYSRREILALRPSDLLPDVGNLAHAAHSGASNGHVPGEAQEVETVLQTRDAQPAQVAVSMSVVPYAGQRLLLVIARDISERQRITRQLLQAEKLAALGRLSASMAHEINNPLQAIHNSVHLLLSRELPDEKRQRYLEMTREEINRLISIVQRILDFYRPTREGMRPVDMGDIIDAVLTLTANQLHEHRVDLLREVEPALPRVLAVSNHIKQVCLSLIFNAIEAMPDGGSLRVRAYLSADGAEADEDMFTVVAGGRMSEPAAGPSVVVEISDTGAGISSQDLPKIFEPFYTTRIKGTGLSLALSHSIVEQHHGEMAVRSELGQGTLFRIRLPVAQ
ncbi:PAS domain S-box protein [Oscillochloris sp. ZM17-4]|uniref:hybrid sensor histidine kinase/response regulator n=1 Tax=Oscillochloris sp. ZM17-4 TaxID=2866714 RepID=UPI001C72D4B1|nr:ATP-binding protein [Oscillochloris sp. ZM17-4]MBX0327516.1 PAS domain S-box protein [Oscillochloris sp. ZM17-4]